MLKGAPESRSACDGTPPISKEIRGHSTDLKVLDIPVSTFIITTLASKSSLNSETIGKSLESSNSRRRPLWSEDPSPLKFMIDPSLYFPELDKNSDVTRK